MDVLLGPLLDPLGEQFMRRGLAVAALVGITAGALGCWVLLYGISYAGESMAHSVLPGLLLAAIAGLPLLAGGVPAIALAAVAIALASSLPGIGRDTAVAVVVTGFFGLGGLLALSPSSPAGLEALLFGDILGTSAGELLATALLASGVLAALWLLHSRIKAVGFDPSGAGLLGAGPAATEIALLLLLAATVLIAVQALGNLLVVAILIAPAAAARLLTNRIGPMMAISIAFALGSGAAGLYASYYAGTAAGASIAAAAVLIFLLVSSLEASLPWKA